MIERKPRHSGKSGKILAPLSQTVFTERGASAWCWYPAFTSTIQKAGESSGSHLADAYDTRQTMQLLKEGRIHVVGRDENLLTRAPLGYFYNAPHWGGGLFRAPPPSDLRNYWTDSKNSSGIWKPWKNWRRKTNFIDLGVTNDVTGQVKVKMFDISGLVTSASKIAMLSTNKAN